MYETAKGSARRRAARVILVTLLGVLSSAHFASAQNNTLDLRFLEFNDDGGATYQNFIYSRSFAGGKWAFQGVYLRLPEIDYDELAAGLGYRFATTGGTQWYLFGSLAHGTDDDYFQPALFALDLDGKVTGSLFLLRYIPLGDEGIEQWLIDPVEVQYNVFGRTSVGLSGYFYRPDGGSWLRKIGPKLSVTDRLGASELAVRDVNQGGGVEVQLRRIFVF
jgi:hypothetical protein